MARHRGGVLAVERPRQCGPVGPVNPASSSRTGTSVGRVRSKLVRVRPDRRQRLRADQHDLGIGGGIVAADQLDAGLGDLPVRRKLAAAHAQALPGIGQPQRPRRMRQARGGDARHLRRGVGAQAHHALAFRVHQPERLLGHRRAGAGQQAVLELQQRRLHPLIAVRGEHLHERLDRRRLGLGIGRQQVAQPGRQQRAVVGDDRRSLRSPAISYRHGRTRPRKTRPRLPLGYAGWRRHSRRCTPCCSIHREFILGFLPVALAGFFLAGRVGGTRWALRWLVAASLFFYGWWNPKFVLLLAGSILANYWFGQRILGLTRSGRQRAARRWLIAGVAANLALLGWFKYANFLIAGRAPAAHARTRHLPAAGDQLLHLPADHVPGREQKRRPRRRRPAALRLLRRVLSAPDRRSDRAAARDHAATAGARSCGPARATHRRGADDLPARPGEEARAGGHVRELLRCGLRRRGTRRAAELRRGMVCGRVLRAADLLRFLRLFRHGDRPGAHDERAVPGELRQPLQGGRTSPTSGAAGTSR